MESVELSTKKSIKRQNRLKLFKQIKMDRWLYFFLLPGLMYFILFKYVPMWGVLIAFQKYNPFLGVFKSEWVGFMHFKRFFSETSFMMLMRNTIILGVYNLFIYFPIPVILSLMLNEVRKVRFKKVVQTMIYLPHFLSWVVVVGLSYIMFTTEGGIVNNAIAALGGEKIPFLLSEKLFRPMYISQIIWKESGYGTIIFLAALAGVDIQLYEAAVIDGANRWQQLIYITLPAIQSTIAILLILRLGHFLDTGFEQIFLMLNAMNRNVADVFDTYVYDAGITQGNYSYSTAVGLFKSVVGLLLVSISNFISKKFGEEGIF